MRSTEDVAGALSARALEPLDGEAAVALDAHAAASSPPAESVAVGVVGEPAGAVIWQDNRRVAVTPAALRLAAGTELELTAPGRTRATFVVPATRTTIAYNLAAEGTKGSIVPAVRADEVRAHGQMVVPTPNAPPPPPAPIATAGADAARAVSRRRSGSGGG